VHAASLAYGIILAMFPDSRPVQWRNVRKVRAWHTSAYDGIAQVPLIYQLFKIWHHSHEATKWLHFIFLMHETECYKSWVVESNQDRSVWWMQSSGIDSRHRTVLNKRLGTSKCNYVAYIKLHHYFWLPVSPGILLPCHYYRCNHLSIDRSPVQNRHSLVVTSPLTTTAT